MSLAVFPLRVQVQDVTIGEDPRYKSNLPFADIGEMDISVKLFPLLSKTIAIESLTLKRPKIELIKDQAGVWNFASLGEAPAAPATKRLRLKRLPRRNRQPTPPLPHKLPRQAVEARLLSINLRSPTARSQSRTTRNISRARCTTTST